MIRSAYYRLVNSTRPRFSRPVRSSGLELTESHLGFVFGHRISTPYNEVAPYLDGLELYFSLSRQGLWKAIKDQDMSIMAFDSQAPKPAKCSIEFAHYHVVSIHMLV